MSTKLLPGRHPKPGRPTPAMGSWGYFCAPFRPPSCWVAQTGAGPCGCLYGLICSWLGLAWPCLAFAWPCLLLPALPCWALPGLARPCPSLAQASARPLPDLAQASPRPRPDLAQACPRPSPGPISRPQNRQQHGPKTDPKCQQKLDNVVNIFLLLAPILESKMAQNKPRWLRTAPQES